MDDTRVAPWPPHQCICTHKINTNNDGIDPELMRPSQIPSRPMFLMALAGLKTWEDPGKAPTSFLGGAYSF